MYQARCKPCLNTAVECYFTFAIATFQDLSRHHLLSTDPEKSAFTAVMSPSSNKLFPGQNPPQQTDVDESDDLSKVGEGRLQCVCLFMDSASEQQTQSIHRSFFSSANLVVLKILFFFSSSVFVVFNTHVIQRFL
jgi:hypothetical protein